MCDWFVQNKLSLHFGQDKKNQFYLVCIFSIWLTRSSEHKFWNAKAFNIGYNGIEIKQYKKVKYLGYVLDQSLSGESMALNVIDKVNSGLKFLHSQNPLLIPFA